MVRAGLVFLALVLLSGCASAPPPRAMTPDELQYAYGYFAGLPMRPSQKH